MPPNVVLLDRGIFKYRLCAWGKPLAARSRDGVIWKNLRPEVDLRVPTLSVVPKSRVELRQETMAREWGWPDRSVSFDPIREDIDAQLTRRLGGIEILHRSNEVVTALKESVPSDVRGIVERFASRQWEVLRWASEHDHAVDLLNSTPSLAFALSRLGPRRAGPDQMGRKQRELCALVGLPATDASVKILRKLPPESCTPESLRALREIFLRPPELEILAHLPRLTSATVLALASPELRNVISASYVRELTALAGKNPTFDAFSQLTRYAKLVAQLSLPRSRSKATRVGSLAELRDRLDRILADFEVEDVEGLIARKFPDPPLTLPPNFSPITSLRELYREGLVQRNCVAGYASKILQGERYVYTLLKPERATVAIERKAGRWNLQEIKRARNQSVSRPVLTYFVALLNQVQSQRQVVIPMPLPFVRRRRVSGRAVQLSLPLEG